MHILLWYSSEDTITGQGMMISKTKISAEGFEKVEITAKMAEVFGLPKKAVGEWAVVSKEYFVASLEKGSFRRIFCRRQVQ